ncbi:hypothetical protein ACHAWF_018297 [Thalassiosira exigua]
MSIISTTLLDEADQLVTLLGAKSDSTLSAAALEARVTACISEHWRNPERGNIVPQGILDEFRSNQPPVQSISLETPAKSVVSSLGPPQSTNALPATTPGEPATAADWSDDDASVDDRLVDLFVDDDSDFTATDVDSDIELDADDIADEHLGYLSDAETEVTAQTETTTGTGSVALADQPPARRRGRPPGTGGKRKSSIQRKVKGPHQGSYDYDKKQRGRKKRGRIAKQGKAAASNEGAKSATDDSTSATAKLAEDGEDDPHDLTLAQLRMLISLYYTHTLGAPGPELWHQGRGESPATISLVLDGLGLGWKDYRKVKTVLKRTWDCLRSRTRYDGKIKWAGGGKRFIKPGSEEEQDIARYKEEGCSFTEVTWAINDNRARRGETEPVTRSAVFSAFQKMCKIVQPINKRSQGNSDVNSDWAKARHRWVCQLLLRLGYEVDLADFFEDDQIPECFDKDKLREEFPLYLDAIGWWDEVHKKCHIGDRRETATEHVQFPRDDNGRYHPEGHYSEEPKGVALKVKYENEGRFCPGVAIIDGEGKRLKFFNYSQKKIISISDWNKAVAAELARVSKLKPGNKDHSAWVESNVDPFKLYLDSPLVKVGADKKLGGLGYVRGFGKQSIKRLGEAGYKTVSQMITLAGEDDRINALAETVSVKTHMLKQVVAACCKNSLPINRPPPVDHTKAPNPYKSRYGDDWEAAIAKSQHLRKCVCIKEMVTHIFKETEKAYSGTKYAKTWMVYHDALSLMTAEDCIAWMKTQMVDGPNGTRVSYYDKWVLPVLSLNDKYKKFKGRPIGNSPEMMPLDNCLNKDWHESVARHAIMSQSAARSAGIDKRSVEGRKLFSIATPAEAVKAYERIWDPETGVAPRPSRIVDDIKKVVDAMKQIHKQKGAFVPDLAQRPGNRHIVNEMKSKIAGGARTKNMDMAFGMGHVGEGKKAGGARKKNMNVTMRIADRDDLHPDLKEIWHKASAKLSAIAEEDEEAELEGEVPAAAPPAPEAEAPAAICAPAPAPAPPVAPQVAEVAGQEAGAPVN